MFEIMDINHKNTLFPLGNVFCFEGCECVTLCNRAVHAANTSNTNFNSNTNYNYDAVPEELQIQSWDWIRIIETICI